MSASAWPRVSAVLARCACCLLVVSYSASVDRSVDSLCRQQAWLAASRWCSKILDKKSSVEMSSGGVLTWPRPPPLTPPLTPPPSPPWSYSSGPAYRPFATGPQAPPGDDIRNFYSSAVKQGFSASKIDKSGAFTALCDFSDRFKPDTHTLTDVVWQRLDRPFFMNRPVFSANQYPNSLHCPDYYIRPPSSGNFEFIVSGLRAIMRVRGGYSMRRFHDYRCYATVVNRFNAALRTPVYNLVVMAT